MPVPVCRHVCRHADAKLTGDALVDVVLKVMLPQRAVSLAVVAGQASAHIAQLHSLPKIAERQPQRYATAAVSRQLHRRRTSG